MFIKQRKERKEINVTLYFETFSNSLDDHKGQNKGAQRKGKLRVDVE